MWEETILFEKETFDIRGAIFEVYREMGCGFLEAVYQECLEYEMISRNIPFRSHPELVLEYKERRLQHTYRPDFICYEQIVVELKAVREILPEHMAQLLNYLKATGTRLGLRVNFGHHPKVQIKRLIL